MEISQKEQSIKELEKILSDIEKAVNKSGNSFLMEVENFRNKYKTYEEIINKSKSILSEEEIENYKSKARDYNENFWRERQI